MPIPVDFRVDQASRTSPVRENLRALAFGNVAASLAASNQLAARLSSVMDRRSSACLLVMAGLKDGARSRVAMWTFPQEAALRLSQGTRIEVLDDVFNLRSRMRKAAIFEGQDRRTDFIRGHVLDFQAASPNRQAADFWIDDFLQCELAMRGDAGTRELARCVKKAYQEAATSQEQEALHAGMMALRTSPRRRWSLAAFADSFLTGDIKGTFLSLAANDASVNADFDFVREVFDRTLNFRVFRLDGDVFVSAPFDEVGPDRRVVLTGGEDQRLLRCEGTVLSEEVKARHA